MSYMEALRHYNDQSNEWCNPKKGTPEYEEVRALMNSNRVPLPKKDKPPRKARKPKMSSGGTSTSTTSIGVDASTQTGGGRMKAGRPRKIAPNLVQPPPVIAVPAKPVGRPKKQL
jgi:hypothetical protein